MTFDDVNKKYDIDDLLEEVNNVLYDMHGTTVGMRQIRDDIKYMRDRVTYNAPIKTYQYDGKKCYYRYEDPNFTIFNNELSVEEVNKLRSTIEMLGKYRGILQNFKSPCLKTLSCLPLLAEKYNDYGNR